MKTYYSSLKPALLRGITPAENPNIGFPGLRLCNDLYVQPLCLRNPRTVAQAVTGVAAAEALWPQLFVGESVTILAYETLLYVVTAGAISDPMTIYDVDLETEKELPSGTNEPWHFVDFGYTWLLVKPDVIVFRANLHGLLADHENKVVAVTSPTMSTACAHRGRMISAGFDKANFWSDGATTIWNDLWNTYYPNNPAGFEVASMLPTHIDQNFVMWSTIGGGDILYPFFPILALQGMDALSSAFTDVFPFLDHTKRNERGWMPLESQGEVLVLKPLGKNVVAYSSDAVTLLVQVADPVPTFGKQTLMKIGVPSRGAVGGNDSVHLFFDTSGTLWKLTAEGLQQLGYKDYFAGVTDFSIADEIRINYDEQHDDFYINLEVAVPHLHVLSPQGLSSSPNYNSFLPSAAYSSGALAGVALGNSVNAGISILTEWFDLGYSRYKKLTELRLDGVIPADAALTWYVYAIDAEGTQQAFSRAVTGNANFLLSIQGEKFSVGLSIVTATTNAVQIDDIVVGYQISDLRFTRGVNVGAAFR